MKWNGLELPDNPYFHDSHLVIYNKDSRSMAELPDGSIQCVVTSPPYWGLRKYSGEQELVWGGEKDCQHQWGNLIPNPMAKSGKHSPKSIVAEGTKLAEHEIRINSNQGAFCAMCGAWKGSYGLEPTPEMYIEHTILFLREIRRVLRKDGVVFWNIGDSYWGGKGQSGQGSPEYQEARQDVSLNKPYHQIAGRKQTRPSDGQHMIIKPKDLCLIPFRVAIAAQQDNWWVRSVIIWSKPNPMPESVIDRPTESHEYILMLTKSAKYYWDAEAVREPYTEPLNRWGGPELRDSSHKYIELGGHDGEQHYGATSMFRKGRPVRPIETGRNIRSVWEFPTQPYPEAHFATFPEKLPEICIKAATPEVGCCSKCGAPWVRVIEVMGKQVTEAMKVAGCNRNGEYQGQDLSDYAEGKAQSPSDSKRRILESMSQVKQSTWQPTCNCQADVAPALILDPFAGSGTTLWVAKKLGRQAIGYELSMDYCKLALERNRQAAFRIKDVASQ